MPYYDTIEEDLARAREILRRGKVDPEEIPVAMRDVAHIVGGTIYGVDTYAAYKLLESFVEEIERSRNTCEIHADVENIAERTACAVCLTEAVTDGELLRAGLRDASVMLHHAAEVAERNFVPALERQYREAGDDAWALAGPPA